jgi:hypothetical protein
MASSSCHSWRLATVGRGVPAAICKRRRAKGAHLQELRKRRTLACGAFTLGYEPLVLRTERGIFSLEPVDANEQEFLASLFELFRLRSNRCLTPLLMCGPCAATAAAR